MVSRVAAGALAVFLCIPSTARAQPPGPDWDGVYVMKTK